MTMTPILDRTLYVLPFDHCGASRTMMFGWQGALTVEQTAKISAMKQVIYDGFRAAPEAGVARKKPGMATAAAVPGFIGFAVGRTTFRDALTEWHAGRAPLGGRGHLDRPALPDVGGHLREGPFLVNRTGPVRTKASGREWR